MRSADNLTTFMCWLSRNLEPQTPGILCACNRPVQGLLYLLPRLLRTITSISGIDTEGKVQHTYTVQLSAQLLSLSVLVMHILGTGGYFRSCQEHILVRMKKKICICHLSIQDICHSTFQSHVLLECQTLDHKGLKCFVINKLEIWL